ncbi:hypothetical protein HXX76_007787 [Chlamydomonas incerta]|uniref:Guanylate cyclase domain-containing protein n=1 Tax=Chlamydomonas incerta TaxID=51695 RepID=A0A835T570_CHLIN|nr:hypothetical protein HXX76_007787 [Chlamydomonas incerta]|eukprot:KAG2434059.1 hypothetical protein HXX76_007787 [Chlamydomonas incerta]
MEGNGAAGADSTDQQLQVMVPTRLFPAYARLARSYSLASSRSVTVVPVDEDQLLQEALFEFANKLNTKHDAWILQLDSYWQLESLSALLDLTNLTAAAAGHGSSSSGSSTNASVGGVGAGNWAEVPPAFRRLSYSYDTLTSPPGMPSTPTQMSVPLDGSAPLMLYRTDALAAAGLSRPPATWAEVLAVATAINGTDLDGDGLREFALCFRPDPDCSYTSALGMVLAPYLQYNGTATGALLAPEDLQPLLDSAGASAALGVFKALLRFHIPLDLQGIECAAGDVALAFAEGECAIAFGWGELFKLSEVGTSVSGSGSIQIYNGSSVVSGKQRRAKGRYAMAPLPGSSQVYDREQQALVECGSAAQCPYGAGGRPEPITAQDGRTLYVNRAPYLPYTGVVGLVAAAVDPERQRVGFDFLSYLSAANLNLSLSNDNPIVPFRTTALSPDRIPDFVAAGYDEAALRSYMAVVNDTVHHPNLAPGPLIPRGEMLRALMGVAAANLSAGMEVADVAAALQAQVVDQVLDYQPAWSWRVTLKAAYWSFTGYSPPPANGTAGGEPGSTEMPAVSLAVPVASAVVVLLLSTLYEFKKHRQHRSLFGKVVAPGPFEDTTLLVTDIQDSTALWEMLPSSVMDRAIKEHHTCLRKLLLKHSGYESATEGDSFLLAFHCPEDALLFAMEAQVALLECAWPMELLDCDVCRPAYVVHNDGDKRANLLADAGDMGGGGGLMALPRASSGLSNKSTSEDTSSPQASNMLGASGVMATGESNTFLTACQASWKEATAATPNNVLIFRGLRVRMGMHTGISNEADVAYNKAAARMQYSGEILNYGKSVSDAAAGGMILLSEATYRRLPMERLWDKALVMHVGEYRLKDDLPVLPLYQVTGRRLMGRLGQLAGMRFKEQLSRGVFTAPLGAVAMVYVGVAGVPALLAWDEALTRESLALLHGCLAEHVRTWGGYLVEAADEQVHVVFPAASDAVLFCLAAHQAAMELPWPDALLDHELAEELIVGDAVVFRGLRLKSGVDAGHAVGEVNALTGRICYRGKVVARAARVMQNASSNQVLASGEAWAAALAGNAAVLQLRGVVGDRLGPFKLRGVAERVEVVQVRLRRLDLPGAEGWAQDLQQAGDGGAGTDGEAATTTDGEGPQSTRPGSLAAVDLAAAAAAAGGGSERPASSSRFGFLGRRSSHTAMVPTANGGDSNGVRGPTTVASPLLPASRLGADSATAGSAGPASPRLFGGLLRSARAQSFSAATSGLIARMTGRGRAGSGAPTRMPTSGGLGQAADGSGGSGSAASGGGVTIASGGVGWQAAPDGGAAPARNSNSGGGGAASGGFLRNLKLGGGGAAAAAATGGGGGGAGVVGGTPRGTSPGLTFPLTSARRLLPSWGSSGQGHNSGGNVAAAVATSIPANRNGGNSGGYPYMSDPSVGGAANANAAAAAPSPPATSLPAAGADSLSGGAAAAAGSAAAAAAAAAFLSAGGANPVSPQAIDTRTLGPLAAAVSGPGAVSGGAASSDGPGWFPGEMLADVLHGVQEEDEAAAAAAAAAASSAGMGGVLAAAAGGRQVVAGAATGDSTRVL